MSIVTIKSKQLGTEITGQFLGLRSMTSRDTTDQFLWLFKDRTAIMVYIDNYLFTKIDYKAVKSTSTRISAWYQSDDISQLTALNFLTEELKKAEKEGKISDVGFLIII